MRAHRNRLTGCSMTALTTIVLLLLGLAVSIDATRFEK